jgi:hypothetical protein
MTCRPAQHTSGGCAPSEPAPSIDHLFGQSFQVVEQLIDGLRCSFIVARNYVLGDRAMELGGERKLSVGS